MESIEKGRGLTVKAFISYCLEEMKSGICKEYIYKTGRSQPWNTEATGLSPMTNGL